MTTIKKAEQIKKLIFVGLLDENIAVNYLSADQTLFSILKLYFSSPDEEIKDLLKKGESNPASKWTDKELKYYNIEPRIQKDISKIIPLKNLTQRAKDFLEKNKELKHGFDGVSVEDMMLNSNDFQQKCYWALVFENEKSRVDRLMEELLENILDEKVFSVIGQHRLKLRIKNITHPATADCIVYLLPLNQFGVICIEDNPGKSEAEAIADAIAVAQQEDWIKDCPIFILRSKGLRISIYKAIFSENLLEAVRKGHPSIMDVTYVEKFAPKDELHRKGLDLLDPSQREQIVLILCSIESYFLNFAKNQEKK